jgi:hypothetical protein
VSRLLSGVLRPFVIGEIDMSVVVASSRLDQLLSTLGRLTTPFAELPPGLTAINVRLHGDPVLVGEVNGLSYLIEYAGTAFSECWGLLARTARELNELVIGAAYDPPEEHCEFFVANGPNVLRAFWSNPRRTTRAYSVGVPLASEAIFPLSTAGGRGLAAALEGFGFPLFQDDERDVLPGERWVTWKGDLLSLLSNDELGAAVKDHVRAYANPTYRPPEPVVRVRRIDE